MRQMMMRENCGDFEERRNLRDQVFFLLSKREKIHEGRPRKNATLTSTATLTLLLLLITPILIAGSID